MKAPKKFPVATIDIETDPFLYGRIPEPFVIGWYSADIGFRYWWGDDCIERFCDWLRELPKHIVYAHNGGKFDVHFFLDHLRGKLLIIDGRTVSAEMYGHDIRDSYAIMPFPLADYQKDEIDYSIMERPVREKNKRKILEYLESDCVYLFNLIETFHEDFGQSKLTIGSVSMAEIRKLHDVPKTTLAFDRTFRKTLYYGGRCESFASGVIEGDMDIYDVRSMYPSVMSEYLHPTGLAYSVGDEITEETCFLTVRGTSHGAFPGRGKDGELHYSHKRGVFHVSIHEYNAAIDSGVFRPTSIECTYDFAERVRYEAWTTKYYALKEKSERENDQARYLIYKYLLNAGGGKFSQNPANYWDYRLAALKERPEEVCQHCKGRGVCTRQCHRCAALNEYQALDGECRYCEGTGERWMLAEASDDHEVMLWKARTPSYEYNNVATGASITGAARAKLLRAMARCETVLYCDTDSIVCQGDFGEPVSNEMGAWKHEGHGVLMALAAKKLYCIFSDQPPVNDAESRRRDPC